jgi:O-Antigen ligase
MEWFRNNSGTPQVRQPDALYASYWCWLLSLISLVPVAIVLPMAPTKVGIAVLAGWITLIWVAISFVLGQFHTAVPAWVAIYPYCYYFLSFPAEHSIFTVDRALVLLLVIEMVVVSRHGSEVPLTRDVRVSAYFWGLYLVICFLSLAGHAPSDVLPEYRLLIDGMVLPALFGLYAIRYLPLPEDLHKLHIGACILGLGLFITGLIEITTGLDLFPWNGALPLFTDTNIRRADGPFEQQEVLAMVAILLFFFVIYLRRLLPDGIPAWRALLHKTGSLAAFGAALIPLNRGLILVLVPIAIIDSCSRNRWISRRTWAAVFVLIAVAAVAAKLSAPRLYDDRVARPDNFYQRLAQHRETLRVIREYPFFGVGFGQYHDLATQNPRYMAKWKGIESMNVQHNALMTVLSEEGIVGLLFYVLSQAFLMRAMWRIRAAYPPGWLIFLYCFLVYVLIGLDYATVYFSDINLLLMLIFGVLYQLQARMARQQESDGNSLVDHIDRCAALKQS